MGFPNLGPLAPPPFSSEFPFHPPELALSESVDYNHLFPSLPSPSITPREPVAFQAEEIPRKSRLKIVKCSEENCPKVFRTYEEANRHFMNNHDLTFPCNICHRVYRHKRSLNSHHTTKHLKH